MALFQKAYPPLTAMGSETKAVSGGVPVLLNQNGSYVLNMKKP
jgi:hypothetical protein